MWLGPGFVGEGHQAKLPPFQDLADDKTAKNGHVFFKGSFAILSWSLELSKIDLEGFMCVLCDGIGPGPQRDLGNFADRC